MHIVIVDSSSVVLKLIAGLLEPRGHKLELFTDSQKALDFVAQNHSVRALITSLETRPLTGIELCWAARLIGDAERPLSIIVTSANRSAHTLAEALDSGADDFIEKPPSAEELHARLRAAERLTTMQSALIRLAETDPLTGLFNRRAFLRKASDALVQAHALASSLCAVLIDIDHFKRINDTFGHDIGDSAIRAVAELVGGIGIAGRLGGEEYALILPETGISAAMTVAEELRRRAFGLRIRSPKGPVRLTCSFGVAEHVAPESVESLIQRADEALYEAKEAGRNRIVPAAGSSPLARFA